MQYRLGFIGAGNMAEAIVRGAIESNVLEAGAILAADPTEERRDVFASLGVAVSADAGDVVARCEQVLLAVKPQVFPKLADTLCSIDRDNQIVISIMAGVKSAAIEVATGGPTSIIRVMPNTPLMVGAGMSAVARCGRAAAANHGEDQLAIELLGSCGEVAMVSEDNLDAVTAVSGSGPAYVFLLAEAMAEAAVEMGLGGYRDLLVQQTILGAAKLMLESDESPEALRRKVTSPGGTTQAAIESFQASGFEEIVTKALRAARDRSVELGG